MKQNTMQYNRTEQKCNKVESKQCLTETSKTSWVSSSIWTRMEICLPGGMVGGRWPGSSVLMPRLSGAPSLCPAPEGRSSGSTILLQTDNISAFKRGPKRFMWDKHRFCTRFGDHTGRWHSFPFFYSWNSNLVLPWKMPRMIYDSWNVYFCSKLLVLLWQFLTQVLMLTLVLPGC